MFQTFKTITLALVTTSLTFLFPGAEPLAAGEGTNVEQCLDPETCPIPYLRLSKQKTEPFLFQGKVVDEDHPRYADYGRAINRFPDVRSCLIQSEQEKSQPDLRQIDWEQIKSSQEIDVCVFRIAASIADVGLIRDWLLYHGFRLAETSALRSPSHSMKYKKEPAFGFTAYLTVDEFREIIPRPWFAKIIGFEFLRGYSLTFLFSSSEEILEVTSSGGTIFN